MFNGAGNKNGASDSNAAYNSNMAQDINGPDKSYMASWANAADDR